MLRTQICRPNAHVGSLMSTFGAGGEFPPSCRGFDFQRDMLDLGLLFCLYLPVADAGAAVGLCSSFYHLIYSPSLPTPLQIHTAKPPSSHTHTHTKAYSVKGFFPPFTFFFISVVTCRLSALHRHRNYSSELAGKKKKSLGSSSPNKVLKQCLHLHFILWRISALYCASKREL